MDYQNRAGNKGAGVAGASEANVDRRERLRRLALETIDLAKDPYILRNHLGSLECRLCLTLHTNEGSYLAHTQGKKHQTNLARRAAREAKDAARGVGGPGFGAIGYKGTLMITGGNAVPETPKKRFNKIGRPGYNVTKIREPLLPDDAVDVDAGSKKASKDDAVAAKGSGKGDQDVDAGAGTDADADMDGALDSAQPSHALSGPGGRQGLLFQVQLPLIAPNVKPLHRFMSSFEQTVEPQSRAYQYLVVAAEPYETIAFKIPSRMVERKEGIALPDNGAAAAIRGSIAPGRVIDEPPTWSHWSPDSKTYTIQVIFR